MYFHRIFFSNQFLLLIVGGENVFKLCESLVPRLRQKSKGKSSTKEGGQRLQPVNYQNWSKFNKDVWKLGKIITLHFNGKCKSMQKIETCDCKKGWLLPAASRSPPCRRRRQLKRRSLAGQMPRCTWRQFIVKDIMTCNYATLYPSKQANWGIIWVETHTLVKSYQQIRLTWRQVQCRSRRSASGAGKVPLRGWMEWLRCQGQRQCQRWGGDRQADNWEMDSLPKDESNRRGQGGSWSLPGRGSQWQIGDAGSPWTWSEGRTSFRRWTLSEGGRQGRWERVRPRGRWGEWGSSRRARPRQRRRAWQRGRIEWRLGRGMSDGRREKGRRGFPQTRRRLVSSQAPSALAAGGMLGLATSPRLLLPPCFAPGGCEDEDK